jgi:hypothetical protein
MGLVWNEIARPPEGNYNTLSIRRKRHMKRIFTLLAAAMLVFGVAGNAMAAFDVGNLTLVAYEGVHSSTAGNEAIFNLGAEDLTGLPAIGTTVDTGIAMSDFDATDWADIKVGLVGGALADDWSYTEPIYFTSDVTGVTVDDISNFQNAMGALYFGKLYGTTADKMVYGKGDYGSYITGFDATTTAGSYGLTVKGVGIADFGAEVQLGDGIYYTDLYESNSYSTPALLGTLSLDTTSGSLVVGYTPVPVPGALVLFGSALLGMVGLRRKNS